MSAALGSDDDGREFARLLGEPGAECFVLPRSGVVGLVAVCGASQAGLFVVGRGGAGVLARLMGAGSSHRGVVRFCRLSGRRVSSAEAAEFVGLLEVVPAEPAVH